MPSKFKTVEEATIAAYEAEIALNEQLRAESIARAADRIVVAREDREIHEKKMLFWDAMPAYITAFNALLANASPKTKLPDLPAS